MRLEKLRIGGPGDGASRSYKNLKDVTVDFDENEWITVGIGWNGTGKSNVLEVLALIFRELIRSGTPDIPFAFFLRYRMANGDDQRRIQIDHDPERKNDTYRVQLQDEPSLFDGIDLADDLPGGRKVSISALKKDPRNVPKYVFSYYSGEGTRLQEIFQPYLQKYDGDLRAGRDPGLKRLFYAMPAHSQFVLLAFLIQPDDQVSGFLRDHLGIDAESAIESVLFTLRQPPWAKEVEGGDRRFWNARGVVKSFLSRLMDAAYMPLETSQMVPVSLWNRKRLTFKYFLLRDVTALRALVGSDSPATFFRDLESTYVSQLIEEVRIRVRIASNGDSVTFRELSEGEQQLLTVLGLLRFTREDESLFLLDEPDTHLNPRWSVDYLHYLRLFLGVDEDRSHTSHVVMTTHNPIAVAGLEREQVQVFSRTPGDVGSHARHPAVAPKGMGYAGVVTSDMFGLGSALDRPTSIDLRRLHELSSRKALTDEDLSELVSLRDELKGLDFNFASRDRLEQEFRRARFDLVDDSSDAIVTPENKARALDALVKSLLRDGGGGGGGAE